MEPFDPTVTSIGLLAGRCRFLSSPEGQEVSGRIEGLNPVVVLIGYINDAAGGNGDAERVIKLSRTCAEPSHIVMKFPAESDICTRWLYISTVYIFPDESKVRSSGA